MFGFKKKEQKPLWIMGKDVMKIIRSDYDEGMAFTLIEFHYQGGAYLMGACVVSPEAEERKENISFVFQDQVFRTLMNFRQRHVLTESGFLNWKDLLRLSGQGLSGMILC